MTTHQRGQRNTENNHEIHHGDTRTPPAASPLAGVLLAVLFNYLSAERGRRQVVTWVGNMTHSDKGTKRNDLGRFDGNNKTTTITSSSSLDVDR